MNLFQTLRQVLRRPASRTRFHWMAVLLLTLPPFLPAVQAQVQMVSTGNRSLVRLTGDPARPVFYGLSTGTTGTDASLVAFNAADGTIRGELPLLSRPTDFDLAPAEDALYVINYGTNQITRVDLGTFTVSAVKPFAAPNPGVGDRDPLQYDIVAGPGGILYYVDAAWSPVVHRFDFPSGQDRGGSDLGSGVGDIALSHDGKRLFTWRQYGWSAGNLNSFVSRVDVTGAGFVVQDSSFTSARRDPLDTPILLTESEDRVFNKKQCFDTADLSRLLVTFSENLYAISLHGEVAVGTTHVFNALTGAQVYTLPFTSTVSSFSGDQRKLIVYETLNRRLALIPTSSFGTISGPGLKPTPADGAVVPFDLAKLVWSSNPLAVRYRVYLGANRDEVLHANPDSTVFAGETTGTEFVLSKGLTSGQSYYWRVDTLGSTTTNQGPVWAFDVARAAVAPAGLNLQAIAGFSPAPVALRVEAPAGTTWSATDTCPWFEVAPSQGGGSGTVTLTLKTAALTAGKYTNSFTVESGGARLAVPVVLEVLPLDIRRMVADLRRPYIYAIQAPAAGQSQSSLLFINTDTEQIDKVLPVGVSPSDLTVNYAEGRLYVADWGHTPTWVVDLQTQEPVTPLQLGTDVYRINAAGDGKIITEGYDQFIYVNTYDTRTGLSLNSYFLREGDGEVSPLGNSYYHCDNDISNAQIHKFDLGGPVLVEVAHSLQHPFGTRNLVLSGDGTRLFWNRYVFDADLNELGGLGEEIYATTLRGELAFSDRNVFDVAHGKAIFPLPFKTGVLAVAGKQDKVFLFNQVLRTMTVLPLSQITSIPVPGPGLVPTPADDATVSLPLARLSWTASPFATRYALYFGTSSNAVAHATPASPEFRTESAATGYALTEALKAGQDYFWRVDEIGFAGAVAGAVWNFYTSPLMVAPQAVVQRAVAGLPIPDLDLVITSAVPGVSWTITESLPWLKASVLVGATPSKVRLHFDSSMAPGSYQGELHLVAGGHSLAVPVSFELLRMNLSKLVADRERPLVYGLHPGSGSFDDAFLVVINAETEQVERVIPAGSNPTDLSVGYGDRQLYVSNWKRKFTRVFSLDTWEELPPLALGPDVYRLNAAGRGRLITEEEDQWIAGTVFDTATGAKILQPLSLRQGDGEASPAGDYYYHCDDNISDAHIHKFSLTGPAPVEVANSAQHPYGSRNLVLCDDGSRLFWRGYIYDSNLTELGNLGEEIYAVSPDGHVALSAQTIYDTRTRAALFSLPFHTGVMTVSGPSQKVFLFNPVTAQISALDLRVISDRPPTAQNASFTLVEDTSVVLDLKVSDPDNDPLTLVLVEPPAHGLITTNAGRWVYTPATNYSGTDALSFSVSDRWLTSAVARVTFIVTPVNDRPTAFGQDLLVGLNGSLAVNLTGDDPEGFYLRFTILAPPLHGQLSGTPPAMTYRATPGYMGPDQFSFVVNDGTFTSAPATVRLQVGAPLKAPVLLPAGLSRRTNGAVMLVFEAPASRTFTVMATDDLVHWKALGNSTAVADNRHQFLDSSAKAVALRLYRLDAQ